MKPSPSLDWPRDERKDDSDEKTGHSLMNVSYGAGESILMKHTQVSTQTKRNLFPFQREREREKERKKERERSREREIEIEKERKGER